MRGMFFIVLISFFVNHFSLVYGQQNGETKTWEERNRDQPFVYLLDERTVRLNDDWSFEEELHYRIKIQKDMAKDLGEQEVYYNKSREEILDIQAFVETPDGEKFPFQEIQDLAVYQGSPMFSDFRVKVITLPQVMVGSVIDVYVKGKTSRKSLKNHFWDKVFYPNVPTQLGKITFIFPFDKQVNVKPFNTQVNPVVQKDGKQAMYQFIFKDTEDTLDKEPYMPPYEDIHGFNIFSSVQDWGEIADWYRGLLAKNTIVDQPIEDQVKVLIKDKKTQEEKASAILEFIQDNFRYVALSFGDHTVEPHSSAEIFQNRYGDCKDWTLLAKQMLALAGIKSNVCLFADYYEGNPQNGLPMVDSFHHVILEVFLDGKSYFVDPQTKGYGFGENPSSYDGAYLLVVGDKSFRFDHIPVSLENNNAIVGQGDAYIQEDGSCLYDLRLSLGLDQSIQFREVWQNLTQDERKKFMDTFMNALTRGGEMVKQEWFGLEGRYGKINCDLKFKRPFIYPIVNDMIIIKEDTDNPFEMVFSEENRKYAIFFPFNSAIKSSAVYHAPQGFKVDSVPEGYMLSLGFVELIKEIKKKKEDIVEIEESFLTRRSSFPLERYKEIKDFWNKYHKQESQYVILKKK